MKKSVEVVQATIDDLDRVVPLFDAYRQFYKRTSDLEGARRFLLARFEERSSVLFLAFLTDEAGTRHACGFTQLYPSFSSTTMKRLWILNDLFVAPEARHSGAGRALLERARALAHETEARGLMLQTAVDNITAQALYESAGWQRDEQFYVYNLYL